VALGSSHNWLCPNRIVRYTSGLGGSLAGSSLAAAGDLNQDGYDDFVIGSPGHNNYTGLVHVIYGSSQPSGGSLDWYSFNYPGDSAGGSFGQSVAGPGDLNEDGYPDILVGAPGENNLAGAVHILYGPDLNNVAILNGVQPGGLAGHTVAGAGDVNGDGKPDFLVGAVGYTPPGNSYSTGAVYLVLGGSTFDLAQAVRYSGTVGNMYLGQGLAGAGDVNGDGYDDIVVGAPYYDAGKGVV
jgi:hypothetical protein